MSFSKQSFDWFSFAMYLVTIQPKEISTALILHKMEVRSMKDAQKDIGDEVVGKYTNRYYAVKNCGLRGVFIFILIPS